MLTIDSSTGEGGGQILRSALALAMLTGQSFQLHNIRANRKTPGLRRQHLASLSAAAEICNARVSGDALGSREIIFQPGSIQSGAYFFDVGTAGSTSLVLQTILPPLLQASESSTITIKGGTHNPFAPPFPFLQNTFTPVLRTMGFSLQLELLKPGFFPAGSGSIKASIQPTTLTRPLSLLERGQHLSTDATAMSSNLPHDITHREIQQLAQELDDDTINYSEQNIRSRGPRNAVWIKTQYENICETFTGFGQKGKPVQRVIHELVTEYRHYMATDAPVGPHLADQLLLPMVVAGGGEFVTSELTLHTTTNIAVIGKFMDIEIEIKELQRGLALIRL